MNIAAAAAAAAAAAIAISYSFLAMCINSELYRLLAQCNLKIVPIDRLCLTYEDHRGKITLVHFSKISRFGHWDNDILHFCRINIL